MTIHIPTWVFIALAAAVYVYFAWGSMLMRRIDGRDNGERPIVSLAIGAAWPVRFLYSVVSTLVRRPR